MDISTAVDILTFVSKFAYCYFLAGIVVCTGIYVFVIAYSGYLGRKEGYRFSSGYWWAPHPTIQKNNAEAANKFNKRKVFRLIFVLAVIFKIFWI